MKNLNSSSYLNNDEIYQALKKDIVNLKLLPGQMISENEISKKYMVSRTPVKSAFLRLMSEKFIEIIPQRGSYVTLLDMEYIKETIYMRMILETTVLLSVTNRLSGEDIAKLQDNLSFQEELVRSPQVEPKEFYETDGQFHCLLFSFAGKQKLWNIIQEFQVHYSRFRMLDIVATGRFVELYQEHVKIFEAIKENRPKDLEQLLHDHLHGNLNRLADRLNTEFKDYFL